MAPYRRNRKNFAPLGTVIDKVLRQYGPVEDRQLLKVWDIWESAVGPVIAANARPVAFKGAILLVHVASSTWLHHLRFLEREMVDNINEKIGGQRVQSIQLKIGSFESR